MASRRSRGSISNWLPTTPREYWAIFARNEKRVACLRDFYRDEDHDLINQYGDPRADADRWGPGLRLHHMLQRRPPSTRRFIEGRTLFRSPAMRMRSESIVHPHRSILPSHQSTLHRLLRRNLLPNFVLVTPLVLAKTSLKIPCCCHFF